MTSRKQEADWVAWVLHFIVGALVGGFIGLTLARKDHKAGGGFWMDEAMVPYFVLGVALIFGAVASSEGDRLWVGLSYRMIPPEGIQQSKLSRRISLALGCIGVLLATVLPLHQFGVL